MLILYVNLCHFCLIFSHQDEKRDPLQRGYSRVDTADGSLSNSSTSTSLDTVVIESAKDSTLLSGGTDPTKNTRAAFSPILETEDQDSISQANNLTITSNSSSLKTFENPLISNLKKSAATSKPSLKGSKVSFEQPDNESSDSFEDRRDHFQQKKSLSATDRKGILKVNIVTHFSQYISSEIELIDLIKSLRTIKN